MVKKVLLSWLFLFCLTSLSYGNPPLKNGKTHHIRVVKSPLSSPQKKPKKSSKVRKKVQSKKVVKPKKTIIRTKTIRAKRVPSRTLNRQAISKKQKFEATLKHQEQEISVQQQLQEAELKRQEDERIVQQQLQEAELKRQEDERIAQQKEIEEQLKQQEQLRIQQEVLAAQQRQEEEEARRKEQERLQQEALAAHQRQEEEEARRKEQERLQQEALAAQQRQEEEEARRKEQERLQQEALAAQYAKIIQSIHPNNLSSYETIGLTEFFKRGYYGQNTTVAVIEGGFYHTLAPHQRPFTNGIAIEGAANNWHEQHSQQILPPLSFYDPVLSPLDQRFEVALNRGKDFRFSHGDRVASAIAEASPQTRILPVQASFGRTDGSFIQALEALSQREDVNIINMSRWLESCAHNEAEINPDVVTALRKCTDRGKLIVLSACNSPNFIPVVPGIHNNLHDISNFGANLISDLFYKMLPNDSLKKHVIISGALENATNDIACYSMRAGYGRASENYIATHADIYSPIMQSIWNGTSASAPNTSAILANLMSARPGYQSSNIVDALFERAEYRPLEKPIYGRGKLNGRSTLFKTLEDNV